MAQQDFIDQLNALGFTPHEQTGSNKAQFEYTVPIGKFVGQKILLGFLVPDDFPANPPSGPHISPRLLPINTQPNTPHPAGGVHESDFGRDWEYWSRPIHNWANTDHTVRTYMAHIRHLFETQ